MAQRPGGWPYDSQGYASYQAGGSTGAGTGPQGGGMPPGDFTRLSQTISSNVQRMVNNVSQIETMNGMIGMVSDNPELRDRLHKLQHETNQLAKSITQQLKDLSNIPASQDPQQQRQRKFQKDRLMDEFTTALKNFQMSQRRQKEREKEAIQRTKNKASSPMDPYAEEELVNGQLVGDSSGRQQMALSHEDDLELLHDREMSVRQLEADIMDVNQIFKELSVLVHEQGEVVDSIEANVESTSLNIARGTDQLQQARNYKARIRERKFCLLIILIAILVIVAIIIGVSVSH